MFTWICPKCGTDVPPAYDECPRCHPPKPAGQTAAPVESTATPAPPAVPAAPVAPPAGPAPASTGQYGSTLYVPPGMARPAEPAAPVAPAAPVPPAVAVPPAVPLAAPAPGATPAVPDYAPAPVRKSTGLRDLGITVGVAVVLLGVGYFVWNGREGGGEDAETKAPIEDVKKQKAKAHPLSNQIEVGGFRITEPKEGQLEIKALVINHSPATLADLQMDVEVLAKGTTKTVAAFPVSVKRLGPYETVEVKANVKTTMRAYELPDWQFLQAKTVIQSTAP